MSKIRSFFQFVTSSIIILTLGLSATQPKSAYAQGGDGIKRQVNAESGKVSFIGPESGRSVSAARALGISSFARPADPAMALAKRFAPEFGLKNPERDLSVKKSNQSENGRLTVGYQQRYQGIPVMGGELIVNTNANGDLYSMNGEVSPDLSLSTEPTIDSEQAKQTALQAAAKWYQKTSEDFLVSEPELWIYDESLLRASNRAPELVWRMEVTSVDKGLPVRELVLVNAQRGNVSLHFNQVDTARHSSGDKNTAQGSDAFVIRSSPNNSATYYVREANKSMDNAPLALAGATWYVATTGNDSNSCTATGSPCKTINGAIGKAADGDTILIAEGLYTDMDGIAIFKTITLRGGWNSTFSTQTGVSAFDFLGETVTGLYTEKDATIERIALRNGYAGFWIAGSTNVTLRQSSVYGMSYHGIRNSGNLTLENSTVSGNLFEGIDNLSGTLNIINSTITNNSASGSPVAGGIKNSFGTVVIQNSILAGNTDDGIPSDCYGEITSTGNNIIGTTDGCSITSQPSDLIGVNLQISTFLSSGYHVLFSSSPAINAGNASACPATDQRGVVRPVDVKCDIGAYEYTAPGSAGKVMVQTGSYQIAGLNAALSTPIKALVLDSVGSPVSGKTVTFASPGSGASGVFSDSSTNQTTAVTDVNGIASASTFTANSTPGSYNITASVSGVSETAKFVITNVGFYVKPGGNDNSDCLAPATACLTINGAMNKASANAKIFVAGGTYTGIAGVGHEVVVINKSISLSGGWDISFSTQNQQSIIDGQNSRNGIDIPFGNIYNVNATIDNFIIKNSGDGLKNYLGTVTLRNSSLINNQNGINNQGTLTVTNITASQNSANGIANHHTLTIENSTIVNNLNGIYSGSYALATVNIQNSILAKNGSEDVSSNCQIAAGSFASTGYNIIDSTSGCSIITHVTDMLDTDPLVSPLLDGGFHALFGDSPAINSANLATCPATDQRKVGRPIGTNCDIGAFEYRGNGTIPAYIFSVQGTPQHIRLGSTASSLLKASVLELDGDSVSGKTVTFTAPANGASGTFANTNTNVSTAVTATNGIASASAFSANNIIGSYVVKATVSGLANSADFQLFNGVQVYTYSANNSPSLPGTLVCDQGDPNCAAGDVHAKAAHKYAIGTYNFYASQHGRDSIDNNGMAIISSVHYCSQSSCPYNNAFWDGTQMVFGGGFPLADDVVAHEFTHGVTQNESNLLYYYQSGAINESFSDLWGEYYDQINGLGNDTAGVKWLHGEDISGSGANRSMINPPAFGDPDKMSSANYYEGEDDSGGVHTNSGINNKAAYLIVDGGTFNGKTITALGWAKSIAIFYEAQTDILTSGSDYSDLYYALQQACSNLIGQNGITVSNCQEVKDALDAVEMNGQPAPNFNTDAPICDAGISPTYIFTDDIEAGTANWTFTNATEVGATTRWQVDSPYYGLYAQSGVHSLYADDYPDYITDASARLVSFTVPVNGYLHFAHAYDFEDYLPSPGPYYFDGGVLEYSFNGGSTWLNAGPLIEVNGYDGTVFTGAGNPLSGRSAFVGTSHGYISTRVNLVSLTGKTVTFRWRMGLDEAVYSGGWWVDNVKVYSCIHPNHNVDVTMGGTLTGVHYVPSGQSTSPRYKLNSGPVHVESTNGQPIFTSQRAIFGSSFNSIVGYAGDQLTTDYWFTSYDDAGMITFLVIGNPHPSQTAEVDVFIGGTLKGHYSISPGQRVFPRYGINAGPVHVVSTNGVNIFTSERTKFGNSFNEVMGYPGDQLTTEYWFTSYDDAGMITYLVIGNPHPSQTAEVDVYIAGVKQNATPYSIAPGQRVFPRYGINSGPVRVVSTNGVNIFSSERTKFGNTFNEVLGFPGNQVSSEFWFTSYDDLGMITYLVVGNPHSSNTAEVDVYIGGVKQNATPYQIAPGQRMFARYGINSGPVHVVSTNGVDVFASERSKYLQSFNEILGIADTQLTTDYWFTSYDDVGMNTFLVIGAP